MTIETVKLINDKNGSIIERKKVVKKVTKKKKTKK